MSAESRELRDVLVVTPVYEDWESLAQLCDKLLAVARQVNVRLHVLAVDDGSVSVPRVPLPDAVEVLSLACNLGHQRAIAIALAFASAQRHFDALVVMDADGEDAPETIPQLLQESRRRPDAIVVAARTGRTEGLTFQLFYRLYRLTFRLFIGQNITFGNFSLIPRERLTRLVSMPELWNHLAGTYLRSRIPLHTVPLPRGKRYHGKSKMNLPALVVHGLSALSVFSDVLIARVLLLSTAIFVLSVLGVFTVVIVKFATDLAIVGWATSAAGLLAVISLQAAMLSLVGAFLLLNGRSQIPISLAREYERFVQPTTNHKSLV
jgi:polyisoprenyl-phosphate glycosyltransferase